MSLVIPIRNFFFDFLHVALVVSSREDCCNLSVWVLVFPLNNLSSEFFLLISPIKLLIVLSFLLTPNNTQIQSDEEGFMYVQASQLVLILPSMCS